MISNILAWAALLALENPLSLNRGSSTMVRIHNGSCSILPYLSANDLSIPLFIAIIPRSSSCVMVFLRVLIIDITRQMLTASRGEPDRN